MPSDRADSRSHPEASGLIRSELDGDGVLTAVIDMPGRRMNVFSFALMDALEALIVRIEADPAVKAAVVTSGKPSFLAGADLTMVQTFTERASTDTRAQMFDLCGRLGRLFRRLELVSKPVVAAVNGLAFGGGLELALACRVRMVSDDPRCRLGVPEVKLGLLPGAGGTQRLPRFIGVEEGLRSLLSGDPVDPQRAVALNMFDEAVPAGQLLARAKQVAVGLVGADRPPAIFKSDTTPFNFSASGAVESVAAHYGLGLATLRHYPAYRAIINAVIEGWSMPLDDALDNEMHRFLDLMFDPVAGNMIRTLFINRQRADKLSDDATLQKTAVALSETGESAAALVAALTRAKIPLRDASTAGEGDLLIVATKGAAPRAPDLALLTDDPVTPTDLGAAVGIYFRSTKEHGGALEIVVEREDAAARAAALGLARRLGATPFVHTGRRALLPAVLSAHAKALQRGAGEEAALLAGALAAARMRKELGAFDADLADVAAVVSGAFPAFAGGPFGFLRQLGDAGVRAQAAASAHLSPDLFVLPDAATSAESGGRG
jgi:3-hydroxyacyl-CoA dehydrogenase/enoyl-CoA hydratase/3-hydroxybutyryl-CoA epimerase